MKHCFFLSYILPDTSKKSYQKTRIIKRDPNPVFNHTIVYDGFHTEDLKDACVELTVWDHERLTNHFLGGIRLGVGTGKWVTCSHPLIFIYGNMEHSLSSSNYYDYKELASEC